LRGIGPPKSRRCLQFQFCVGDFIPEGGFFVLLEGGLLIIHEKVLSTVRIVGWWRYIFRASIFAILFRRYSSLRR